MKSIKTYGSNSEEQSILESAKCREIVHEILNFGVNQKQICALIKLLSLELENRNLMLGIIDLVDNQNEPRVDKPTITV